MFRNPSVTRGKLREPHRREHEGGGLHARRQRDGHPLQPTGDLAFWAVYRIVCPDKSQGAFRRWQTSTSMMW
jgi:hypothetical protein